MDASPGNKLGVGSGNHTSNSTNGGTGTEDGGGSTLSPADLRQKRLAALERNSKPLPASRTSTPAATLSPSNKNNSGSTSSNRTIRIHKQTTTPPPSSSSTTASSSSSSSPISPRAKTSRTSATPQSAKSVNKTSSSSPPNVSNGRSNQQPSQSPTPQQQPHTSNSVSSPRNMLYRAPAPTRLPQTPTNQPVIHNNNDVDDDDEDDEDLQRALALSLAGDTTDEEDDDDEMTPEKHLEQSLRVSEKGTQIPSTNPMANSITSTTVSSENDTPRLPTTSPCNILDFHYIMWDLGITTENDQRRWLSQGIQFKNIHAYEDACRTNTTTADSLLAAIILHYESWGLTQTHGGPCGVLAAIQAEMLRLLLFGPRTATAAAVTSPTTAVDGWNCGLEYPTRVTNYFANDHPDLFPPLLRRALAMAMSIIWARASMAAATTAAAAAAMEGGESTSSGATAATTTTSTATAAMDSTTSNPTVQVVLPKLAITSAALEWDHLEPWSSDSGGSGQSDSLVTYTISLQDDYDNTTTSNDDGNNNDTNMANNGHDHHHHNSEQPHTKRQRTSLSVQRLAEKTAEFLLETNALEWFQRPGGVLLMVMSLAMSRGIPNIQGDMDDPTAKLTSNFGHCSQELINLLLTGQAVSNVFDNTMRPSGELICRGIQTRPDIGYLSQLESMRYLEVGGYYKTPSFPIWVVGSTSHFTVMFGDAACLQESASDILLEKVRRAFKSIDENENGFIQTEQLEQFLRSVGVVPDKMSEHAIPTLAATIEVHGAGIILWEDLWKRTSRLLTGASLETVLEWNGESNDSSTAIVPVPAPAPPPAPPTDSLEGLSDEELARRLQAEWNGEILPAPAPPPPPSPAPAPPPPPSGPKTETYGQTFQLYHYNGLRGGYMKPFRVTRLTADEAIGASVSLGASSQSSSHAGSTGDLEDVLRSKWPSCKINWLGSVPPSID